MEIYNFSRGDKVTINKGKMSIKEWPEHKKMVILKYNSSSFKTSEPEEINLALFQNNWLEGKIDEEIIYPWGRH